MFRHYPDVVSVEQLCEMLHIGKNMAYQLLQRGDIRAVRVGRKYRVPKTCVVEYT